MKPNTDGVRAVLADAPTTPNQLAAMVALANDIGIAMFRSSAVAALHRIGNNAAAAAAFRVWTRRLGRIDPELVRRREEQAKLYCTPEPDLACESGGGSGNGRAERGDRAGDVDAPADSDLPQ